MLEGAYSQINSQIIEIYVIVVVNFINWATYTVIGLLIVMRTRFLEAVIELHSVMSQVNAFAYVLSLFPLNVCLIQAPLNSDIAYSQSKLEIVDSCSPIGYGQYVIIFSPYGFIDETIFLTVILSLYISNGRASDLKILNLFVIKDITFASFPVKQALQEREIWVIK
ncbi:hypothetical protein FGO68_gene1896 [Halteria grandinella]|uniref:Uncharacterized protein n=1 Tax=Halteria grandinella TaxID=5974 RepID=A0A8J8NCP0_HALGN|nr:hypothetical protein FGO68_gene1896 [Halteria grandinella]